MSKSKMHEELISRAGRAQVPSLHSEPPTGQAQDLESDRKKIVQDILRKNETLSPTRKLNEQRRRDFFSSDPTTVTQAETPAPTESVSRSPGENTELAIERPPRQKDKMKSETKEEKNEESPKKTCTVS